MDGHVFRYVGSQSLKSYALSLIEKAKLFSACLQCSLAGVVEENWLLSYSINIKLSRV